MFIGVPRFFWGGVGGSKVCAKKDLKEGQIGRADRSADAAGGGWPGIKPPTYISMVGCDTIRPLLVLTVTPLPVACSRVSH